MSKKLSAIEKYITHLDEIDGLIMRLKYFDRAEGEIIAARVYMTRRAVYKRIDRIVRDMVYWMGNIGC